MLVHSGVQSPQKDVFRVFNFWEISDDISCVCVCVCFSGCSCAC